MKKFLPFRRILSGILIAVTVPLAFTACKAPRTVTSTATYTEVTDSSKVTTTISTKTVEDYQGIKK